MYKICRGSGEVLSRDIPRASFSSYACELYWPLAYCLVPIILALAFPLGLSAQSKLLTVPARALLLAFSGWVLFQGWRKQGRPLPQFPLACAGIFWGLYLSRIIYDYYFSSNVSIMQIGSLEYVARAFGMGLAPALAFAYLPRFVHGHRILRWMFCFSLFFNILVLVAYREVGAASYRGLQYQGYDSAELISPLTIAYGGSQLITLSLFLINFRSPMLLIWRILAGIGMCVGGYAVIRGESRGAAISLVVVMGLWLISCNFKTLGQRVLVGSSLVALLVGFIGYNALNSESALVARIEMIFDELAKDDGSLGSGRGGLWEDALSQFADNPATGSALVELNSGTYPHNHIIEAFMATGVLGGLAFLCITVYVISRAYLLVRLSHPYAWVGALYFLYFTGSMFSSGIIQPELWCSLFAVVGVSVASGYCTTPPSRSAKIV